MQTPSCFIVCLFCILLFKDLSCTHVKKNQNTAEKSRSPIPRADHDVKDDTVMQDIDVRAILIRCPQENENEVFHSNPKSISNISVLRTEAILQFPGYDSDEATFQSNVVKCRRKIVIYLRIRKTGKKPLEEKYIVVNHVFDQLTGKKSRLLNAYVLKIKQEPSFEMYGLKFVNMVNGEATEEVISKSTSNYTGCDDRSDSPTCGFAFYKDERVPFSQGFCCSCDASVNAERQPSCHHASHGGVHSGWKPDESFRQPDKPFEKSKAISESKINKVKEDAKQSPNDAGCQDSDKEMQSAVNFKGATKATKTSRGKHDKNKSGSAMKSTECEKRKWRTSTEKISESAKATNSRSKQPEKKSHSDAVCSKANSKSNADTGTSTTLKLLAPKLENCSSSAQSETTKPVGGWERATEPQKNAPSNFSVTTESTSLKTTSVLRASEMYKVSTDVAKEESANTITENPSATPSLDHPTQEKSKTERTKVHASSEQTKKADHSNNSPCTGNSSTTKDPSEKYKIFMPKDQADNINNALKIAKQSLEKISKTPLDSLEKLKIFLPKDEPCNSTPGNKEQERVTLKSTECPNKGNVSLPTATSAEFASVTDTMTTETFASLKDSIENSETRSESPMEATNEEITEPQRTAERQTEKCSSKSLDSLSTQPNLATNAKWTDDKFNEGDKETATKFAASPVLDLSGLDFRVNNLHNEPFEFSTENVLNSIQKNSVDDILSAIKGELKDNECLKTNAYADSGEETSFKKKEIIAKDMKSILAESETVLPPLRSDGGFDLDKVNDVSLSGSEPLTVDSELSRRLTQDEINDIILASNQELEIEPRLSRKRRKGADRENFGEETSESDDGSSNSTKISCSTESTGGKNTTNHFTTHAHTTQKPCATKSHSAKKHDKFHWLFKQKTTSQHANCTKYPTGPCLTECSESTTRAFTDNEAVKFSAESIKRTSGLVGGKTSRNSSKLLKSKVTRRDKIDSDTPKMSPAKEMKGNHEFSPPSVDSALYEDVHGSVLSNVESNRHVDESPNEEGGHLLDTNLESFEKDEKNGQNIENPRLQSTPEALAALLSQQVDFSGTPGKRVKNEGGVNFPNEFGGDDDESVSDASENSFPLMKPSKLPRDERHLKQEFNDSSLDDSLAEDDSLQANEDHEPVPRRAFGNEDTLEPYGRKTRRLPSNRLDYFNELERQRLEDQFNSGRTIVKREANFGTPDEETRLDPAICGEQQVKTSVSDGTSKSDDSIGGTKDKSGGKTVYSDIRSNEPLGIGSKFIQENPNWANEFKPSGDAGDAADVSVHKKVSSLKGTMTACSSKENYTSGRSKSTNNLESKEKEDKNCTQCVRINPLSKMLSITGKLNSLNKVSNTSVSKPLGISPTDARSKSRPHTEPPPDTGEGKLNAILKDLQQKLIPLIEDAEDKKVLEAEQTANRRKKTERVKHHYNQNQRANRNTNVNRKNLFFKRSKHSHKVHDKIPAALFAPSNALDIKRSQVHAGYEIPGMDDGTSSEDKVGYEPHYITDQVPAEKAKMLDLKKGERNKDKEKCASAVLNKKSSRTSGANDFEQDSITKESKRNERVEGSESDSRPYLELLAAIAADSAREQSCDEKPPIDSSNVGIDTPIYESSCNILENDYASFAEDVEDEEDSESECFHYENASKKKSIVSEDSLSFYPVGSSESDYSDTLTNLETEGRTKENNKQFVKNRRCKRNPHGGVRKNHLKINIPSAREDKIQADNNKCKDNSAHESSEDADNDYISLRFSLDDENGISQLEYDEELDGDDDIADREGSRGPSSRQKRQILAGGHQVRGGQNCADRSTPPNVDPKTYHESAHCLRFSDLWYSVYKVNDPEIVRTIYVQIFEKRIGEDGNAQWEDHTNGKMISLGTNNPKPLEFLPALSLEYHSVDDCAAPYALNASRVRLLVPQPVPKEKESLYPQLQGGPGEYLVLDESLVTDDGDACDVAGVAYEGFARQDERCGRPRGSCLKNQPVQFWRADIQARTDGRKGCYLLENFAGVPENPIKTDKHDDQFLALEFDENQESFVAIELKADFNSIIRVGTSVQITEIHVDSTTPGVSNLTVVVTNTGLASARYRARVADCPLEAPKVWSSCGTPLMHVAPQLNAMMQLRLLGDMIVESMHCSVEVLNEDDELVATRRFRLQLNDRCFCVWWCLCACIGSVDSLKCRPQSQHHHLAGGFEGGVPFTEPPSSFKFSSAALSDLTGDWFTLMMMLSLVMLLIALLMGLTKALVGMCCCPVVGAWGLFIMALGPARLKEYYEDELCEEEVVYDPNGYPVHPITGYHSVRAKSQLRQFLCNLGFFILLLPAIVFRTIRSCCCQDREMQLRDECQEDGCNDNMCFDSYPNDDAREAEATGYVLDEMAQNRPEIVANYADMSNERTPLMADTYPRPKRGAKSKRTRSKAVELVRTFLKQEFTYRTFMAPAGGVEFPFDIPYCIRGFFARDPKGYRWVPKQPLLQHWTFNGDLILMKPPKRLDYSQFILRYSTAEEVYGEGVLSQLPVGFCINVTIQDEISQ